MQGLRWAGSGVTRGDWDAVGPRGAPDWEGREVVRVGGRGASKTPREREELVSNVSAGSGITSADMDDREASADGARGEGVIEGGCGPEEAGEAGDIFRIGVRSQGAYGGDHPFVSKKP